jgi:hypothetical protein
LVRRYQKKKLEVKEEGERKMKEGKKSSPCPHHEGI